MTSARLTSRELRLLSVEDGVMRLGPQTVHLDVTNSCNTDCVTCWDHSQHLTVPRSAAWKRQRADVDQLRAVVDDIQGLGGLSAIIVSGMGEPFTHPDIYRLLTDLKQRGLHVTIITNLVAADVDRVIDIGVDALLVGVQGASQQSYLAFHPSFSSWHWQRLQSQLQRLRGAPSIDVKHVQVLCGHNAHEIVQMVEMAAVLDDPLARPGTVNFKLASLKAGTEAVRISAEQRQQLLDSLIDDAEARARSLAVTTNLAVLRAQVQVGGEQTAPIDEIGCFLGTHYSRITVDGTVLFCCNTEVLVGHLPPHPQGRPFSAWWTSPQWDGWRRRMREGHYLPSCFQCGKLNQNEKLSRRFRELFGDERWRAVTGRGPHTPAPPPARPLALRVLP